MSIVTQGMIVLVVVLLLILSLVKYIEHDIEKGIYLALIGYIIFEILVK